MDKRKVFLKYKVFYNSIRYVKCPVLNNEVVYFNNKGFRHLLIKKRKWRKKKDQLRRLRLLKYAKLVVANEKVIMNYRVLESESEVAYFWSLEMLIKANITIVVIIRQVGHGKKHFFSIFAKND